MSIQTIEQHRAKYALEKILAIKEDREVLNKEFHSRASEFPAMIHNNGLGQAIAFYKSKTDDKACQKMYALLSHWLCESCYRIYNNGDLLEQITQKSRQDYQMAQIEAIALLTWVKKFARAYLKEGE